MNSVLIQQIANGFVVTVRSNTPGTMAPGGGVQTYCADLNALTALLATTFPPAS